MAAPSAPTALTSRSPPQGKKIAIFALPGAYTPTCSAKHVPGYVEQATQLKAAGVDEIWCVSVNDAFVMGAWGRDQKTAGKVRMMADGSADFAKATGLTLDLTPRAWACAPTAIRCWSSTAWSSR
jgi:peroxiredoxin